MKNERQIAELIFDKFRASNCKTGQIVMMRSIRFGLIDKLNPKEVDIFLAVFNGLIYTGYFTHENGNSECIRLTEKGYDYIYDDEKIEIMLQVPWIIPFIKNTDWDKAFYKLWRAIGPQDTATHYIGGSGFYAFIMNLCDDIPPSYTLYIEERRKNELSTSRVDYYNDLINHLDEEKRMELYVNIQSYLEDNFDSKDKTNPPSTITHNFDSIFEATDANTHLAQTENTTEEAPIVFISYSWDSTEHENWVLNLATKLQENGVNVILDKWDLGPLGKPLPNFMEHAITKSQRVICVMTPNYKKKTDDSVGGVGYEYSIISADIFTNGINTSKFIPLFRAGSNTDAIPTVLNGRKYVDMRDDTQFEEKFVQELLRDIHNEPKYKKPEIGRKPSFD